jgi:hypothetical protein
MVGLASATRFGRALRSLGFAALAPALAHVACASTGAPREPTRVVASASVSSSASPVVASSSAPAPSPLDRLVASEVASALASGLPLRTRADLPKLEVSVLELGAGYEPQRVMLVGLAQPASLAIDGTPARFVSPIAGVRFPDLRGDGDLWAVVDAQKCGAICERPRARTFQVRAGAFLEGQGPSYPASMADVDADGVPDFAVELVQIPLCDGCDPARVPDGEDGEALVVVGLESWDGADFARDFASYERWYRDGLADARADAKALAAIKPKERKKHCPREVIQDAALVAVFARVLGDPPAKALAEADAIVAGWDTKACPAMRGRRRPWSELRKELSSAALPKLARKRKKP